MNIVPFVAQGMDEGLPSRKSGKRPHVPSEGLDNFGRRPSRH
jgi:hypothetical protein